METHPNPVMTQHIRGHSRRPSTPQVRDGAGTLVLLLFILKHKTLVYFALPHKGSIMICSERPSSKNRITQESVHRFASQISLLFCIVLLLSCTTVESLEFPMIYQHFCFLPLVFRFYWKFYCLFCIFCF